MNYPENYQDTRKRLSLLLPAELHARLKELADADQRSLHQTILRILERGIPANKVRGE